MHAVETHAWRRVPPPPDGGVPTMLVPEERCYLHWLARDVWSGRGCIVEIGSWLGGSTLCLAAGMRASGHPATGRLQVFDSFVWRSFMEARAPLGLAPGESFEAHFRKNLEAYSDIVSCRARALPDEPIEGDSEASGKRMADTDLVPEFDGELPEPAEILFVDGAKSWRGMRHLLRTLGSRLLPGTTLLVCQDYKYWAMYWVPILVQAFRAQLTPVHDVRSATTVCFRLTGALPLARIGALPDHVAAFGTAEGLSALDAAAGELEALGDPRGAWHVRLGRVAFLAHQGLPARASAAFATLEAAWPLSLPTAQLELARAFLGSQAHAPSPALRARAFFWRVQASLARRLARP